MMVDDSVLHTVYIPIETVVFVSSVGFHTKFLHTLCETPAPLRCLEFLYIHVQDLEVLRNNLVFEKALITPNRLPPGQRTVLEFRTGNPN